MSEPIPICSVAGCGGVVYRVFAGDDLCLDHYDEAYNEAYEQNLADLENDDRAIGLRGERGDHD